MRPMLSVFKGIPSCEKPQPTLHFAGDVGRGRAPGRSCSLLPVLGTAGVAPLGPCLQKAQCLCSLPLMRWGRQGHGAAQMCLQLVCFPSQLSSYSAPQPMLVQVISQTASRPPESQQPPGGSGSPGAGQHLIAPQPRGVGGDPGAARPLQGTRSSQRARAVRSPGL